MAEDLEQNPWVEYLLSVDPDAKSKGYVSTSKLTIGTLVEPDKPVKVRILGVLLLQAHGYQSELAVVQIPGVDGGPPKRLPLTPNRLAGFLNAATLKALAAAGVKDIDAETRKRLMISKQHMARALREMQAEGVIDRVVMVHRGEGLIGLTLEEAIGKGLVRQLSTFGEGERKRIGRARTCVYLRAQPRPNTTLNLDRCLDDLVGESPEKSGEPPKKVANTGYLFSFRSFTVREFRTLVSTAAAAQPEATKAVLADLQSEIEAAHKRVSQKLQEIAAGAAPSSPPLNSNGEEPQERSHPSGDTTSGVAPASSVAAPPTPRRRGGESNLSSAEAEQLVESLRHPRGGSSGIPADLEGCQEILRRCRGARAMVTVAEVCMMGEALLPSARKANNPFGWMVKYLPLKFSGTPAIRNLPDDVGAEAESGPVLAEPSAEQLQLDRELGELRLKLVGARRELATAEKGTWRDGIVTARKRVAFFERGIVRLEERRTSLLRRPPQSQPGQSASSAVAGRRAR